MNTPSSLPSTPHLPLTPVQGERREDALNTMEAIRRYIARNENDASIPESRRIKESRSAREMLARALAAYDDAIAIGVTLPFSREQIEYHWIPLLRADARNRLAALYEVIQTGKNTAQQLSDARDAVEALPRHMAGDAVRPDPFNPDQRDRITEMLEQSLAELEHSIAARRGA